VLPLSGSITLLRGEHNTLISCILVSLHGLIIFQVNNDDEKEEEEIKIDCIDDIYSYRCLFGAIFSVFVIKKHRVFFL
jgi:hypothetical protein